MTERRSIQRHAVILPALCWGKARPDFYAVTVDISTEGIRLKSAARPVLGEILYCSIRHVGLMETQVARVDPHEFAVRLRTRRPPPSIVAKRFVSLADQQRQSPEPIRVHPRIIPKKIDVQLTLEDGTLIPARVLNLSASGVALFLGEPLAIGQAIMVGRTWARVSRQFEHGVGAAFLVPFSPTAINDQTVL